MKSTFLAIGLASLASLVSAAPAADTDVQLESRDPVICIGCINEAGCSGQSDPPDCVDYPNNDVSACNTRGCFSTANGCFCCDVVDGSWGDSSTCQLN